MPKARGIALERLAKQHGGVGGRRELEVELECEELSAFLLNASFRLPAKTDVLIGDSQRHIGVRVPDQVVVEVLRSLHRLAIRPSQLVLFLLVQRELLTHEPMVCKKLIVHL